MDPNNLDRVIVRLDGAMSACKSLVEDGNSWESGEPLFANPTGIHPYDLRVLVRPDPPEQKIGSIIIPAVTQEQEKFATVKATLIALGGNAFREAESSGRCKCPEPGERVMIAKYAGIMIKGADGEEYRIMNDEDVIARLED